MRNFGLIVCAVILGACSSPAPAPQPDAYVPPVDMGTGTMVDMGMGMAVDMGMGGTCHGITGNYNANGMIRVGSTCDAALSTLSGAVTVADNMMGGFTTTLTVGGIAYSCTGVVTNMCRWDATCTGMATDGSMVTGMLTFHFTDTGFSGTLSETFSGTTTCVNMFDVTATRV